MAHKRMKTEDMDVNYKFACRCCLKSEAEFFKLDAMIDCGIGDNNTSSTKLPLIRLLLFCMRIENHPELPQYICVECSKSLQIAYYFIQNGLRAHEILCRKLCPGKFKTLTRSNGQHKTLWLETHNNDDTTPAKYCDEKPLKPAIRHECKVCGAIIHNRMELKQHIRMHADLSSHQCKLCNFATNKHRQLPEHYRQSHGLTASQIELQLRRSMKTVANAVLPSSDSLKKSPGGDGQVKVCTMEDMELLIPTVLTPEDFSHPQLDADQLRDIEQQLANSAPQSGSACKSLPCDQTSSNVSIGAEFLVMPDGSLQQVNDGGVVFEYIDDSKSTNTATNVTLHSLLDDSKTDLAPSSMNIDLSHVDNALPQITVKPKPRPIPSSTSALKHKCKLCPRAFPTIARLKSHQLTHSHLPKFYCDQCSFYSLRSAELIQHYATEHTSCVSENRTHFLDMPQLTMPADRSRIYSCDMCLFEAPSSGQLRVHYSDKHLMVPSEVQLRPTWTHEPRDRSSAKSSLNASGSSQPDIPLGIKYPRMSSANTTPIRTSTTSLEHSAQATTTTMVSPSGDINVVVDASSMFYAANTDVTPTKSAPATADSNSFSMFPDPSLTTTASTTIVGEANGVTTVAATSNPNTSIFGDMQDFIDNTDVAAICTIPADDMPVVDGDDIVIDNNNISLDFDAENLFEDFEDVEVGEDDDDDEDVENEDENDNNDAETDQNLLLTSDDDDVDDFDDEQSKHLQKPYCIYCNKKFTSQYKFENHMFVHRGLAPYRCELCTNLYNMKRLLIRHYKTVHKRMPTRDMVQAKGDKVSVARTTIEKINVQVDKAPTLMCAKCPFECEPESEMRKHLNAHHGINDGGANANEVFIIRKLPYDCPRCIRSFAAKRTLTRHLQRSHLVDTIIEMQAPQLTTSSAATTTTPTATTTLPHNASKGNITTTTTAAAAVAEESSTVQDSNMSEYEGDNGADGDCRQNGDGGGDRGGGGEGEGESESDGKCDMDTGCSKETLSADNIVAAITAPEPLEGALEITGPADSTKTGKVKEKGESPFQMKDDESKPAAEVVAATTTTTTAGSTLCQTPTPFDFDLDFMGENANSTSLKNNNVSFHIESLPSHLLNESDKLLTAALEPSPIKDLRTHLPCTPIFVCKQCNQTFDELAKLLQHELDQHSSGLESPRSTYRHQCKICNTTYRTVTLLNYHMKQHPPAKFSCTQCPKELSSSSDLEQHLLAEHGGSSQAPYTCGLDGCTKTFNYKHHLKRHQTATHTPIQYICPVCGRNMMTSLLLRGHMSSHRHNHSYKCPKCVRSYTRRNPFRRHALREHKWELSDQEIDNIYSTNDGSPSQKNRKPVKADSDQSD